MEIDTVLFCFDLVVLERQQLENDYNVRGS